MVTSIILINCQRGVINAVAEALTQLDAVSEVYSVSGNYDLVVVVRVKANDDLARLVTSDLINIEGIESTESMLAFRAYSKHDLEEMFSIGT